MFENNIHNGSQFTANVSVEADVVIIGSGAGGAVLAKELSDKGKKVILVEEGAWYPTSTHTDLPFNALTRLYRQQGFLTTIGKPFIPVPMGRALGGTTLINSGTCFRTPSRIFKKWNDMGLKSLNEKHFESYFEKVEKTIHVTDVDFNVMSRANTIVHDILKKRGTPGKALKRNIQNCEGCGFCCYGCPSGAKQSMDQSYLPLAFKAGAQAYTNTMAKKILLKNNQAQGVVCSFLNASGYSTGYQLTVRATKVIVSAGSIFSPLLLKQNKINLSNANLGKNLTMHPATKIFALFDEQINSWEGTPQAYYFDFFQDEGIMFEGIVMPPDVVGMAVPFIGQKLNQFMRDYKHMATFGFLIQDSSSGSVRFIPGVGPAIYYSLTQTDVEKFKKGVAFLSRIFLEGGAKKIITIFHGHTELCNDQDVQHFEQTNLKPMDIESMAFHPLGTCRMALTAQNGVVGEDFQVFGYRGLYVCDGSVIPTALGVNPQVTIMAFATHLAKRITST